MKKSLVFMTCLAVCVSFVFSWDQEEYYSGSYARLNYVKGDVFIQRAEDLGYEEGVVNLPIVEGDKLGTRNGRAEIHFGNKNYLRIDNYTQIDIANLPRKEDDLVSLHLLSGNIYLRITFLEREKDFEIHTPDASFYILEEGLFRFDVFENRETKLFVFEGAVEVAGEEGSRLVRQEMALKASDGYFTSDTEYLYANYEDSFSEWSRSRDALHNRYVKTSYLPSELDEYEAELASNGRWVHERSYGYVWVPQVHHYSWRPYYNGRWAWYPIIGWTWVSYDPWGWCVHHYGRWHWRVGLGWYWIPTRAWGPAWVHWHWGYGYNYIGWSPLSYYGYPVVIVNNRFYGRYYGRHYPVHSRAFTVIHKNQLRARHISKVALSQNKVARLGKISLSARQPDIKPVINRSGMQNSVAAKVLSRSNVRSISPSSIKQRTSSLRKDASIESRRSSSRLSSSKSGIKVYQSPSRSLKNRSASSIQRGKALSPRISGSTRLPVKNYSSRNSNSASKYSSAKKYVRQYSSSTKGRLSGSGSTSKTVKSRYSSRIGSSSQRSYSSRSYTTPSKSYTRSRSSSSRYIAPSKSYSPSRSYSSKYTAPSRSYTKIKSSSSGYKSSSRGKISSSRSYSAPRISKSSSSSRTSRSYSSSRSSSSKKVKKR